MKGKSGVGIPSTFSFLSAHTPRHVVGSTFVPNEKKWLQKKSAVRAKSSVDSCLTDSLDCHGTLPPSPGGRPLE